MLVFTLGCWQSAQAFTAGTSPPGGPETQLPSDVSNVKNGPEFVAAFANPSVRYLRISSPEVNVLFSDWGSGDFKPPLVLKRDIVIEGNPEMPYWPTINLRDAPGVVRMAHNVTMTVRHVFASGFRDNPTRAPGLDFLLPTLQGEIAYLLVGPAAGNISLCFPNDFQILDFGLLEQMGRPSMFPGRNEIRYNESQCWPQKTRVVDLAAEGADYDITRDMNTPNGLMIHLMNLTLFCDAVVDPKCLKKGEPLVCYLEARKKYLALRTLLLVVAGLLAVAGWRRCRQQRRGKVYEDSDGEGARCGAIPCRGDDDTKNVEPQKAAAPVIKRDEQTGVTFGEDHELHAVRHEQKLSAPAAAGLNAGKGADLPAREKSLDGGGTPKDAPGKKEPSQLLAAVADDEATEELKTIAPKNGDAVEDGSSGTEPPTVELLPVVLGKGGFGRVVEGLYGGRRVAVKLLASDVPFEVLQQQKADSMPNNFLKSFEQEMQACIAA
ncbi:hypothetical protein VOLCADRAFT_88027 [Volvox carteri f. nagariensis]|uniref:Protein kinase domain-containing protein n=1 Tax=Volvox carteri f. nagariensis TaxID=3068 RepID=D8TMV9_VOLCA|nr:uncharacterized protein VOLCADRAFT_88027 [Volvox carteri f. nagariensis]EFJ51195.1 hypothetical protein VOLCADRAFT_88027 [Volvox carteri f. nagariensis]|eukprot:XP_002947662.1 hypothetical protein VOLCADRAFT_88027 [Volvox carteri f. nagariensis]